MNIEEENLIFLISQPRSGSSLLQQLMLNSQEINSSPEPWQMLSLIHTFKKSNIIDGYNPSFASINFVKYLNSNENGLINFKETIKKIALSIYNDKCESNNYFLDKTPRYYHIIDELYDLFPNAKFVFLVRNPLSVFGSILNYNFKGGYSDFLSREDRKDDLFLAPKKIETAINKYSNCILVKYEDIIDSPKHILKEIFTYLSLSIPQNINYTIKDNFKDTSSIDTKSLKNHNKPVSNYLDSWKTALDTSQKKKLALEYLLLLQKRESNYLGYNLEEIINDLKKHIPLRKTYLNLNLGYFINKEENLNILQLIKKRVFLSFNSNKN